MATARFKNRCLGVLDTNFALTLVLVTLAFAIVWY